MGLVVVLNERLQLASNRPSINEGRYYDKFIKYSLEITILLFISSVVFIYHFECLS